VADVGDDPKYTKPRGLAVDQTAASPVSPALLAAPELDPGAMVGDYRIESKVGEGGMGVVYAAVHPVIGKRAAIKVMNPSLSVDAAAVERFVFEARAVNQIGHPRIVDVFAFGRLPDGRSYCVMEWLEGQTLASSLHGKRMSLGRALDILLQVCEALEAAHEKGIIHRDLKPENIFLQIAGRRVGVKLLDFGVAKLADGSDGSGASAGGGDRTKTKQGLIVGTPLYMSPEQASSKPVDHRTDIYALGVTAYEMIVGRPPFDADNATDVMHMHLHDPPPPLRNFWERIPPALEALVLAMLEKSPDKRPSLAEVSARLLEAQPLAPGDVSGKLALSSSDPARPALEASSPRGELTPVPARRARRWAAVAALGAAAAIAAIAVVAARRSEHAPPQMVPAAIAPGPLGPPGAGAPTAGTTAAGATGARAESTAAARINVTVNVPARIELDGKPVALSVAHAVIPLASAGAHTLVVTARGREPHRESIVAEPGASLDLSIKLERPSKRPGNPAPKGDQYMLDPFER
jgi:eukaryotic-like serine/threonine-protein kinase